MWNTHIETVILSRDKGDPVAMLRECGGGVAIWTQTNRGQSGQVGFCCVRTSQIDLSLVRLVTVAMLRL